MEHDFDMDQTSPPQGAHEWSQERLAGAAAPMVDVAAAVAHEVANAVSAIAGWAELGMAGGTDPQRALALIASCARTAEQAARRMLRLARGANPNEDIGLLDVSQQTSELLQLLTITARQARVELVSDIEPELALTGARAHWFSLLWNLVKNAIEASPAGATVRVGLCGDDAGIELVVADEGAGIDEAAQACIFSPYVTSKSTGTGLGLHLVRESVEALGGHLLLRSRVGAGSTFRARLPRVSRTSEVVGSVASTELPEKRGSDTVPRSHHGLDARLLVVDDDDALREMMATALSLRGATVQTARNAEQARAHAGPFDVALIDMTLDDIRGDELLAQLRRRGTVHAAMLVTGTAQTPKLVPGGEPDHWVRKPFEISDLVDRLKRTLERHRMLEAATAGHRR